jgi:hypothetical protein
MELKSTKKNQNFFLKKNKVEIITMSDFKTHQKVWQPRPRGSSLRKVVEIS